MQQLAAQTDDRVDAMRAQKDEALEQYRKELERQKRLQEKQAPGISPEKVPKMRVRAAGGRK